MGTLFFGVGVTLALLVPYNLLVWLLRPGEFLHDLRQFSDLARSSVAPLAMLVIAIGAPVSEELMFRGFLLPALMKSGLGFAGAAAISTLAWTALHINYSLFGLLEVYLIGLVFCWLMRRYGNLWLTIGLHALYNGLQFAFLMLVPLAPPA